MQLSSPFSLFFVLIRTYYFFFSWPRYAAMPLVQRDHSSPWKATSFYSYLLTTGDFQTPIRGEVVLSCIYPSMRTFWVAVLLNSDRSRLFGFWVWTLLFWLFTRRTHLSRTADASYRRYPANMSHTCLLHCDACVWAFSFFLFSFFVVLLTSSEICNIKL